MLVIELFGMTLLYASAVLLIYFKALDNPIYWFISMPIFLLALDVLHRNSHHLISDVVSSTIGFFILMLPVSIMVSAIAYSPE